MIYVCHKVHNTQLECSLYIENPGIKGELYSFDTYPIECNQGVV
jgi:hypothetical protein